MPRKQVEPQHKTSRLNVYHVSVSLSTHYIPTVYGFMSWCIQKFMVTTTKHFSSLNVPFYLSDPNDHKVPRISAVAC